MGLYERQHIAENLGNLAAADVVKNEEVLFAVPAAPALLCPMQHGQENFILAAKDGLAVSGGDRYAGDKVLIRIGGMDGDHL